MHQLVLVMRRDGMVRPGLRNVADDGIIKIVFANVSQDTICQARQGLPFRVGVIGCAVQPCPVADGRPAVHCRFRQKLRKMRDADILMS